MKHNNYSPLRGKSRRILLHLAAGLLSLHIGLTVSSSAQAQTGVCFDEFPGLPVILGSNGPDRLYATNSSERICGLAGNDEISAGGGNDKVVGNEGNDTINGGDGADLLRGGKDNDSIDGWFGNDTLFGDLGIDTLYGGYGDDLMYGGDGNDMLNGSNDNDTLNGENGNDILDGSSGNDSLNGNAGNDTIYGNWGNDIVNGGQNDDTVNGGLGADNVAGDLGNDKIYGERDDDNLWGGDGIDTFYYYYGDGHDVIWDFRIGTDKLKLLSITRMSTRREGSDCIVSVDENVPGSIRVKNMATCSGILSAATTQVPPHLTINHEDGAPGSIFTIIGAGFNPDETTRLDLNGEPWTTVQADANGGFALLVDTKEAAPDMYLITVPVYQQTIDEMWMALEPAGAKFALNPSAEMQVEGAVEGVAAESTYRLSLQRFVYLPLVQNSQE